MSKTLGLVLGSGAARGWAHIGVLQALEEMNIKPDVIAGCSVGALVGGAYLIEALDELERWARELKPVSALQRFSLKLHRGGFINTEPAFSAFREFDKNIEDLPVKFGAAATDLATGEEVAITQGSVIDAARISSAIPVVFHAIKRERRWLVDGALANPVPVSLARQLGADVTICVDLNAVPKTLDRFEARPPGLPAVIPEGEPAEPGLQGAVTKLISDTQTAIQRQFHLAKSRVDASPHLFETAYATADIFQMHLAQAQMQIEKPDILLRPNMRDATPTAFDRADEFIEEGRLAMIARRRDLETLLSS